ncbi:nucleoside transporter, putative [Entamoeba histolytica HM-1:IMSS-B]|nr:equilibrative nucleoside transporter, putative [Entamoeba histolytica KU27]EMH76463.1 nucleoside transporter, putative [Entamoeba histolytica HM-1:IMSS-B]EMS13612.1 equilibrative nucleoside transporter, putative [Entamoeba histolytica HM-3:IMSS]ENY59777.1 nucleoside transporter, putative [Entamoeba histolytica HM-1:IMSS-A]GAT98042.1 nucleoside transporter putative [Entamoeba histolytica]
MNFGNQKLTLFQNILTVIFFFFFGSSYLMFYNTLLNVGDLLATHFTYDLSYMSTFPLFYNWFNFLIAIIMTYLASSLKSFPHNILAHTSFILHILLFVITPFALVFIEGNAAGFWVMICISTFNGLPTPINSSVFMGLSGMFSNIHSAIYFIGMAAGGLISSLLRMLSNAIFKGKPDNDYFLTFYMNGVVLLISYAMYMYMYFCIPLTKELYSQSNQKEESVTLLTCEGESKSGIKGFFRVFKKMFINLFSIGFIFFVTLSIFPGFFTATSYDESTINQSTTVMINTFIFMLGDLLSRFAVYIPIPWNKWPILGLSVVRVVFYIPVFIYYYEVYDNPFVMFAIMLLFSFSNGYVSAWAIQIAYKDVDPNDMKIAGNLVMVAMNVGLSIGGTLLFIMSSTLPTAGSSS